MHSARNKNKNEKQKSAFSHTISEIVKMNYTF